MEQLELAPRGTIPQRLDRLPLTWTLWRLALVTQAGWAFVVATDAIAARIYPFVWGPGSAAFLTDFKDTIAQRLPYALAHRRGHLHPAVPDDRIRGHPDQGPTHEHPCR